LPTGNFIVTVIPRQTNAAGSSIIFVVYLTFSKLLKITTTSSNWEHLKTVITNSFNLHTGGCFSHNKFGHTVAMSKPGSSK